MAALLLSLCALLALAVTYAGYPLLVWALSRLRPPDEWETPCEFPTVTMIVPTFNEADNIEGKLSNLLALDIPSPSLKVIVSDDGSTDDTIARVESWRTRFGEKGWELQVVRAETNEGKAQALNRGVRAASSDVLVFTDADSRIGAKSLGLLLAPLSHPRVACVSGRYVPGQEGDLTARHGGEHRVSGLYWRYEDFIRRAESRLWTILGATGALVALRREVYEPLPQGLINDDFVLAMNAACGGWRAVYEPRALAVETRGGAIGAEYGRRVRIMAGNWQHLWLYRRLLMEPLRWRLALQLVGHKMLRVLSPFWLLTLAAGSVSMALTADARLAAGGVALLIGQSLLYGLAAADLARGRLGLSCGPITSAPRLFVLINLAALHGLWYFLFRGARAPWRGGRAD